MDDFDVLGRFARVLRDLRKARGLSQEAFASLCGIDRTYVSLLERKKRQPTLSLLFKVATALDIPASEIVYRIEGHTVEDPST